MQSADMPQESGRSEYQGIQGPNLRVVGTSYGDSPPIADDLIARFLAGFSNSDTTVKYANVLRRLFHDLDVRNPADLTEAEVVTWITTAGTGSKPLANNTVRGRITALCSFLTWCSEEGIVHTLNLRRLVKLRKSYPATYGKAQGARPPRWLSKTEAFDALVGACQDGTVRGLRDEICLRLGLSGLRVSEVGNLTVGDLRLHEPSIHWIGKGRKARNIVPGASLVDALRRYLDLYAEALGHDVPADAPVICQGMTGHAARAGHVRFGTPVADPRSTLADVVAHRSKLAALGHVAMHDLRRSAAGILHKTVTDSGAHHFDLLDIQKVLGHADPATTMRSYLDPMDTGVTARASTVLD